MSQKISDLPAEKIPDELLTKQNLKRLYDMLEIYNTSLNSSFKLLKVLSMLPRCDSGIIIDSKCLDIIDDWIQEFSLSKECISRVDNSTTLH